MAKIAITTHQHIFSIHSSIQLHSLLPDIVPASSVAVVSIPSHCVSTDGRTAVFYLCLFHLVQVYSRHASTGWRRQRLHLTSEGRRLCIDARPLEHAIADASRDSRLRIVLSFRADRWNLFSVELNRTLRANQWWRLASWVVIYQDPGRDCWWNPERHSCRNPERNSLRNSENNT